ncbi:ATP-grasp enzyme [Rhodococcus sp. ARC_M5]|uniref:ATP-grasp enzyme n=1 Tax=Rhodococcus sp. ARC_M5 TaxID=2928851 RepID=UPI001FB34B3A|nr:ATP-grasp enzyme [Rhodococcus sp. ARC_M5]MCJ0891570.1 ATP-grasp enzyme [Rhodococcus sp. ARC_M5]
MIRTLAALAGLAVTIPADLVAAGVAVVRGGRPATRRSDSPRTVLISGGKMTKALQLARSFHLAGHRVVLVESAKYRFTGHRFSRAVDRFHCIPEPTESGYARALLDVVLREGVDVFVPVASPAASIHDADARALLDPHCEVIHGDGDTVRMLDDKSRFSEHAAALGLRVPDWQRITDVQQIEKFDFPPGREYILKRISYNPVGRMDLTRLTRETPAENLRFAQGLGISEDDPWILQQFVPGQEYCTHGTVRGGQLQVYGCCESSAFQVNYEMVDKPEILRWVDTFVSSLDVTGQLSFDFIESAADGHIYAIECNPRTHSAITMFYDHPDLAAAYLDDGHPVIVPRPTARPTYWIYHELWRLITESDRKARLRSIFRGTDAILTGWDPLPYLLVHHLQIPSLLVRNLLMRRGWSRIDFNIGKLVENGGD